jgi:hypothetical protein
MLEWNHCLQLSIKLDNLLTYGLLFCSVFPEIPAAEATEWDKSEVDARSIYVGNVRISYFF